MTLNKLLAQVLSEAPRHQQYWAKLKVLEKEIITQEHNFPTISGKYSKT